MLPARRPRPSGGTHRPPPPHASRSAPWGRLRWDHLIAVWFIGAPCTYLLARSTLLTADGWLRLLGALTAVLAAIALVLDRRHRFGPWASLVAGLFGGLPVLAVLVLSINRMAGRERTEEVRIIGIERRADLDGLLLHLEGGAYRPFPRQLRTAPRDPAVWSADRLRTTFRDGLLGLPVRLHQELLPGPDGHRLPEVPERP